MREAQDGNSTFSLKDVQVGPAIVRLEDGCVSEREEVEVASNGRAEGVRRAFRFCVIESSIVLRERRRKSAWWDLVSLVFFDVVFSF